MASHRVFGRGVVLSCDDRSYPIMRFISSSRRRPRAPSSWVLFTALGTTGQGSVVGPRIGRYPSSDL
ncbi:hypothetical protein RHGRI_007751 [Rhododendron griersonianum]|uniref:Uncharacterized protein n=1 Tax=Rhododendron griersonianum TaxID=479676 RepID=A0AAV6KY82_9ERIC|nr:hypothetical protein RHGRI_007751 [Rhododendron griersonianum]